MSRYSRDEYARIIIDLASILAVLAFLLLRILSTYGASEGSVPNGACGVYLGDTFESACDALYTKYDAEYDKIGNKYWFDISDDEYPNEWLILKQRGGLITEIEVQTIRVPRKIAKAFAVEQSRLVEESYSAKSIIHQYSRRRNYVYNKDHAMFDYRIEREVGSRRECYLDIRIYPYSLGRKIWEELKWACSFRQSLPVIQDLFISRGSPI